MTLRSSRVRGIVLACGLAIAMPDARAAEDPAARPATKASDLPASPVPTDTVQLDPMTIESRRVTDQITLALEEQRAAPNIVSVAARAEFGPFNDTNPGEFLKFLPGIDIEPIAPGYSRFSLHGLGPENTEILFDGMPLPNMHGERTSRRFDVSLISAADIARAEIRKLPLPSDSANAMGGTINLVRRSAFELSQRRVNFQIGLRADADVFTTRPHLEPGGRQLRRWRPNWHLVWTEPVSRDFGFTVALGQDDLILNQEFAFLIWNLGTAENNTAAEQALAAGQAVPAAVSIFNPALTRVILLTSPQQQRKDYASARFDWRPRPGLVITGELGVHNARQTDKAASYQWSVFSGVGPPTRAHDAMHSLGQPGRGSVSHNNPTWREATSLTTSALLAATWTKHDWELSAKAGWSRLGFRFSDTANGYFGSTTIASSIVPGLAVIPDTGVGVRTANPQPLTVDFRHDAWGLTEVEARATSGGNAPVAWWSNDVVRIGGVRSRPGHAQEIVTTVKLHAQRRFAFAAPTSVQLGLDWSERHRDRHYDYHVWRFVGADGLANSTDDSAAAIGAGPGTAQRDPIYGYPLPESVSMAKLYQLYEQHPSWFRYEAAHSEALSLRSDPAYDLKEAITAPYLEFQTTLPDRRLRLSGGVRYERTQADARGLLIDEKAAQQLNLVPGTLAHTRVAYRAMSATNHAFNDGWFPSLHATYAFSDRLALQLGYAGTQARIDYVNALIPNNQVTSTPVTEGAGTGALGRITLQNPNLRPWTADNFEARLSWHFDRGLLALGVFRKYVRNFQPEIETTPLSAAELESYAQQFPDAGLGPDYEGYSLRYRTNAGAARIDGATIEFRAPLQAWLPGWTRGFVLSGNATYLNRTGANGDELGLNRAWMGAANLRYATDTTSFRFGYRYNGEQIVGAPLDSNGRSGRTIRRPQNLLDFSVEYPLRRHVRVFLTVVNLTNELTVDEQRFRDKPAYANLSATRNVGRTCTVGITGTF